MKLLTIYQSLLRFAGMEADDSGFVHTRFDQEKGDPVMINGLRVVLPTTTQLRNYDPDSKLIFHPLAENILHGESDVLSKVKHNINIRLNCVIAMLCNSLLHLGSSPELHKQLNPEQLELLAAIPDVDEKSMLNFIQIMTAGIKRDPTSLFVNIYLKKGGRVRDQKFARAGIVIFPFYQNIKKIVEGKMDKNQQKELGLDKLRVKDYEVYTKLFQYLFPEIDDTEAYNYGSGSQMAPILESLMKTSVKMAGELNERVQLFTRFIENSDGLLFDTEWLESFEDLESLRSLVRSIPAQKGNEGALELQKETLNEERQMVAAPVIVNAAPQVFATPAPVPSRTATAEVTAEQGKTIDFKTLKQSVPSLQPQQMPMQHGMQQVPMQMAMHPVTQTPMMVPVPQYPVQQMMAPQMIQQPMYPHMLQQQAQPGAISMSQINQAMMGQSMQVPMQQVYDQRTGTMVLVPIQGNGGQWTDPYTRR